MPYKNPEDKKAWRRRYAPKQLQQTKSWYKRNYRRKDPELIRKRIEENKAKKHALHEAAILRKQAIEDSKPIEIRGVRRGDYTPEQERIHQRWSHRNSPSKYPLSKEQKQRASSRDKQRLTVLRANPAWKARERRRGRVFNKTNVNRILTNALRRRLASFLVVKRKTHTARQLIGCTIAELKAHLEAQFHPFMTWKNHGRWHIDHIVPCCYFDLSLPEEQARCFHFSNLRPLWRSANLKRPNSGVAVQSTLTL